MDKLYTITYKEYEKDRASWLAKNKTVVCASTGKNIFEELDNIEEALKGNRLFKFDQKVIFYYFHYLDDCQNSTEVISYDVYANLKHASYQIKKREEWIYSQDTSTLQEYCPSLNLPRRFWNVDITKLNQETIAVINDYCNKNFEGTLVVSGSEMLAPYAVFLVKQYFVKHGLIKSNHFVGPFATFNLDPVLASEDELYQLIRATYHKDSFVTELSLLERLNTMNFLVIDGVFGGEKEFIRSKLMNIINKRVYGYDKPLALFTNIGVRTIQANIPYAYLRLKDGIIHTIK